MLSVFTLEAKGVDLSVLYKEFLKHDGSKRFDYEPDWKKAADEELNRRDEEEYEIPRGMFKGAYGYEGIASRYRDLEDLNPQERIVHDLCTADEAIKALELISKRSNKTKKKQFEDAIDIYHQKALKNDDMELEELRIKSIHRYDDFDKMKEKTAGQTCVVSRYKRAITKVVMPSRIQPLRKTVNELCGALVELNGKAPNTEKSNCKNKQTKKFTTLLSKKRKISPTLLSPKFLATIQENVDAYYKDSSCILGTIGDKDICIVKSLADVLKPHQIDGCKFIWKQTFESHYDPKPEATNSGCILAHNMGL